MAKSLLVEGGTPLIGNVKLSGSRLSAQNVVAGALYSTEDVILENVPQSQNTLSDLEMLKSLGIKAEWVGSNRLVINASGFSESEIPPSGRKSRLTLYLVAPLLYRFGKATLPMPDYLSFGWPSINRWIETWQSLGIEVLEDGNQLHLRINKLEGTHINFRTSTYRGTCNAILSALSVPGETVITNAAEEPEVDDLIAFCNVIGGNVMRTEPRKLTITGSHVFNGGYFELQPDRTEAAVFAVGALVTSGNVTIKNVTKNHLGAFVSVLTRIGARYEFFGEELRVWRAGEQLSATTVTTMPFPGFSSDWQALTTLLLTKAEGESLVHDTINTNRFGFTKELNIMGAKIELVRPSDVGQVAVISDDAYDFAKLGEPYTVAKVQGPTRLKGSKLNSTETYSDATLLLAALSAEGKSELNDFEHITNNYEHLLDKLSALGAILKP